MKQLVLFSFISALLLISNLGAQVRTILATDPLMYGVHYLEVTPASRGMAIAALKQYAAASRKDDGYTSVDFFEQIGRPAHFVILEKWTDQKSFDAHAMADSTKQLFSKISTVRLGLDQNAYRTFATSESARTNDRAVVVVSHVDTAGNQADAPTVLRRLAEMSRKEKGNVRFDILQNAKRPNHFTVLETWQSQDALEAHAIAAHTREYRDSIQTVLGSPLDERWFKLVD
jgi:quinol monooxygenase YgiN